MMMMMNVAGYLHQHSCFCNATWLKLKNDTRQWYRSNAIVKIRLAQLFDVDDVSCNISKPAACNDIISYTWLIVRIIVGTLSLLKLGRFYVCSAFFFFLCFCVCVFVCVWGGYGSRA